MRHRCGVPASRSTRIGPVATRRGSGGTTVLGWREGLCLPARGHRTGTEVAVPMTSLARVTHVARLTGFLTLCAGWAPASGSAIAAGSVTRASGPLVATLTGSTHTPKINANVAITV